MDISRWNVARSPRSDEGRNVEHRRGAHKIGCGEFAEYTYDEVLAKKPKYVEFPMDEGQKGHLDMEKPIEWEVQGNVEIVADSSTGSVGGERRMRRTCLPPVGIRIIDNFQGISGGQQFR